MLVTDGHAQCDKLRKGHAAIYSATNGTGRIQRSRFDSAESRPYIDEYLKIIHGMKLGDARNMDWDEFKKQLVDRGPDYGFLWKCVVAAYGPLQLTGYRFPNKVGEEIAKALYRNEQTTANLERLCREEFQAIFGIANNSGFRVELRSLREPIKNTAIDRGRRQWSFTRNSYNFSLRKKAFAYTGTENDLGEIIQSDLSSLLGLVAIEHTQAGRAYGQFSNFDFQGFSLASHVDGDRFTFHAVELKAKNGIPDVTNAINQATNYRARAHKVWAAIPNFREDSFHDEEQFARLVDMCRASGIGVISVNFDGECYCGLSVVLLADRSSPSSLDDLIDMVRRSDWEHCPLCRRAVRLGTDRIECGWKVHSGESENCMKILLEDSLIRERGNEGETGESEDE